MPTPILAATGQLTLTWSSSDSTVDGFKIERSTDATNFTQIAQVPSSPTSYVDTGLASCTTYYYRVRAFNSAGNSGYSNVGSATVPCDVVINATASPSAGGTINGAGTVSSGTTATVTATPNACYSFVNWTEGGTVVSSSPSYSFTVAGNRSLVANFASTSYTVTTGTAPAAGGTTTGGGSVNCGASVTVAAAPNAGYSFVNWTQNGTVVSTSASYTFTATANRSLMANFASVLSPPTGLSVTAVSSNQINVSWNSVSGAAGYRVYRGGIQIAPCAAYSYSDAGLAADSQYCYTVVAVNGNATSVQCSAVCGRTFASPEASASAGSFAGIYNGLAIQTDAPSHASSGYLRLILGTRGSFGATLTMGGARYAFTGQFDSAGNAMNTIRRRYQNPLRVSLRLDVANGTEQITGTVSDGVFTSAVLADRAVYGSTNPAAAYMGRYTMVLAADTNNPTACPQGDGYGIVAVSADGLLNMRGALGDGSLLSQSAPVSKYGTWPYYQVLDNGRGSVVGWLSFTNVVDVSDFEGTIFWFTPPMPRGRYYPAGFTTEIAAVGSRYTNAPPWGPTVLNVSNTACNVTVTLGDGNLVTPLAIPVALTPSNTVTVCGPNLYNLTLTVFPDSGRFSGNFVHPNTLRTCFFAGTVLQTQNYGAGYFRGTSRTGFVALEPTP